MRMRKKGLPLILAAALLLTISPAVIGFAQTEVLMETKLVNVAKNQNVIALGGTNAGSPDYVCDDNFTNRWIGPHASNVEKQAPTLTFDLQRRYPVESIIIFDNKSDGVTSVNRGRFQILGSDTPDFAEKAVLYNADIAAEDLDTVFPAGSEYCITLSERPAYRYIRYQAKDKGYLNVKEIQIWANVNVTEISRNCATYTTPNLNETTSTGAKAVDGKIDGGYYGTKKLEKYPDYFSTFTVDLGSAKHVGLIELYGRKAARNAYADGYFTLFGSNEGTVTDFTQSATEGGTAYAAMREAEFATLGYTQIVTHAGGALTALLNAYTFAGAGNDVLAAYPKYALSADSKLVYDPYPWFDYQHAETVEPYTTMLKNTETPYRYLTHRKTNNGLVAQFSEFRAYELNPEAYAVTDVSATGATVRFSDFNMDAESLTTGTLQVKDADGHVVEGAISEIVLAENGADAALRFAAGKLTGGTAYTLTVGEEVQNTYGTKTGAVKVLPFTTPAALEPYDIRGVQISSFNPSDANNFGFTFINNTAENKRVLAAIALYNGSKIVSVEPQVKTVAANGGTETFSVTAQNSTATSMKVFLWDADTLAPISYRY